jgi:8-amino-3,8-dideoxy-alpha-D-manno-octulosonate transaminase
VDTGFHEEGMIGSWLLGEDEAREAGNIVSTRSLFRYYGPDLRHKTHDFELAFAQYVGAHHALAVNSGTSALRCALAAMNIEKGDEILVPPCTFMATVNAIVLAGAVPVFCEIDRSLGLDPARLAEKLTSRTVGILPVHLQGICCDIEEICAFAKNKGLWVIEDCAQSLGAGFGGRHSGTFGAFGAFSFQAHKTITCGEGGAVICDDLAQARSAKRYHDQGGVREGDAYPSWDLPDSGFGENLKMNELQAGIAHVQLQRMPHIESRMKAIFEAVESGTSLPQKMRRQVPDKAGSLPHSMIIFSETRGDKARIMEQLAAEGIPSDTFYDEPIYRLGPLRRWSAGQPVHGCPHPDLAPQFSPCEIAEDLMARMIRIPFTPNIHDRDIALLVETLDRIGHVR